MIWTKTRAVEVPWYTTWFIRSGSCRLLRQGKRETLLGQQIITIEPGTTIDIEIMPATEFGWIEWGIQVRELRLRHDGFGWRYPDPWPGEFQPDSQATWGTVFPRELPEFLVLKSLKTLHQIGMLWWKSSMHRASADALLGEWLMRVLASETSGHRKKRLSIELPKDSWLRAALLEAEQCIEQIITIKDWAILLSVQERTLHRRCRDEAGQTPLALLNQVKLQKAESMLGAGESIQQISQSCGFNSRSTFTRWFKQQTMMTPREWRTLSD